MWILTPVNSSYVHGHMEHLPERELPYAFSSPSQDVNSFPGADTLSCWIGYAQILKYWDIQKNNFMQDMYNTALLHECLDLVSVSAVVSSSQPILHQTDYKLTHFLGLQAKYGIWLHPSKCNLSDSYILNLLTPVAD